MNISNVDPSANMPMQAPMAPSDNEAAEQIPDNEVAEQTPPNNLPLGQGSQVDLTV